MYPGWITFAGNEIINAERTETYAYSNGLSWFVGCAECPDLHTGLGDDEYQTPAVDEAPWFDPDDAATWEFFGLYPLDITGIEDSTVTAQAVEAMGDGGIVTIPRAGTRTMVFTGMLIGTSQRGNDAGMNWLRGALQGSPCGVQGPGCTGDDLCFLTACPEICGDTDELAESCLDRFQYHLHDVTTIEGPKVTAKHVMSDGGAVWEVEWTMVAAKPWLCSMPILTVHGGSSNTDPHKFMPVLNVKTVTCPDPDLTTIPDVTDPTCLKLPKPPVVPSVPLNCFTLPTNWDRYSMKIPASVVPKWGHAVPEIQIQAPGDKPLRMVRIRFYDDPLNWFKPGDLTECAFCGEFLITYIAPSYTMTVDGMTETVMVQAGTRLYDASQSVTSTDNSGFTWPWLTCGAGYIMTIDVRHGDPPPQNVDVTIFHRGA
jgi:hypothetical protein